MRVIAPEEVLMEKLLGYVFVGGTILLAAADGALPLFLLAIILGGGTYLYLGGVGNRPGLLSAANAEIYERERAKIQAVLDKASEKEKDEIKRLVTAKLEQLQKTKNFNEVWDKEIAGAVGLAVFATPAISVGLLGYILYKLKGDTPLPEIKVFPRGNIETLRADLKSELQTA
jgi:hypothetical protein